MNSTILVYDDEESILEVIQIILEENNIKVVTSMKSENIFNDIEKYKPDLLLIDIWMKGQNGDEIVKDLKLNTKTKYIPVLLVSALNEGELLSKKSGADGFIKKPFDMDELVVVVNKYLKKSS